MLALAFAFLRLALEPNAKLEQEATEWTSLLMSGTPLDRLSAHVGGLLEERTGEPSTRRFLVYVDQGEELYARSTTEQRVRFSSLLAEAAGRPEFQFLASLRSDYYGRLQDDLTLFNASERLDLPPMAAEDLTRAIVEPAQRLGVRFEPASAPGRLASIAASQSGALPLLSDLMAELWRWMDQRGDGILKWVRDDDFADVGRPLSARADRYLAEHPADTDDARKLFTLQLAHVPLLGESVRRRALRSECGDAQWRIVETLSAPDWRLLTMSEDAATHEPTVEVAHEQLLRSWDTLRDWLTESRGFLTWKGSLEQARLDWLAADKVDDALLMGLHLTRALYWRHEQASDLGVDDLSFIEASEQRDARAAQKERDAEAARLLLIAARQKEEATRITERTRAAKRLQTFAVVGVLLMTVLAVFAWNRSDEAAKNYTEAVTQREFASKSYAEASTQAKLATALRTEALTAQSRFMAQAAQRELQRGDYGTSLALAVEALPRDVAAGARPFVIEAEAVLQDIVRHRGKEELAVLRGHEHDVTSAVFSPDGARLLTASRDRTARLWEAASGKELAVLRGHERDVTSAMFSPEGTRLLTASADKTARLWEVASGKELAVLRHEGSVSSALFSPDGARLLTASRDKTARLWRYFSTTQQLIDAACSILPRPLTRTQRQQFFLEDDLKDWPCGWHPDLTEKPLYSAKAAK